MNPVSSLAHRCAFPFLAAVAAAAPILGQGPGDLPDYRAPEFAVAVGEARIADALRIGLNSPGDQLALYIESGLSLGVGANVGIEAGIEAVAVRLDHGGVEVAVEHRVAQSLGIEAFEGLECNASMGSARAVLFHWPSASEAARGLDLLAGGHRLAIASIGDTVTNAFETLRLANEALREAILATDLAQRAYDVQAAVYSKSARAFRKLQKRAAKARRNLSRLRGRVRAASRKVRRLPRFLRRPARAVLRSVSRSLSRSGVLYRGINAALVVGEQSARAANAMCRLKQAELDRAYHDEDAAGKLQASAAATAASAQEFLTAISNVTGELTAHLSGVEYSVFGGAEVSAAIGPAGVQVENLGAGLSAASCLGARIGYRVFDAGMEELSAAIFHDIETVAWAGMVVGVRSEVGYGLEVHVQWIRGPATSGFVFDDLVTSIYADVAVKAVVGAGVALRHGVGERATISLDAAQWSQAWSALGALGGGLTTENLSTALNGISCEVSFGMRWITELVLGGGASIAGTGVEFAAGATWNDAGTPLVQTLNAGETLQSIGSATWAEQTTARLQSR